MDFAELERKVGAEAEERQTLRELLESFGMERAPGQLGLGEKLLREQTFQAMLEALVVDAEPPAGELAETPFDLEHFSAEEVREAAALALRDGMPAGEERFAFRQWKGLLRAMAFLADRLPHLRGEVFAYGAMRAFSEFVATSRGLNDNEIEAGEGLSKVFRHIHARFRASHPGLGEAAYGAAPLALAECLRLRFPPGGVPRVWEGVQ